MIPSINYLQDHATRNVWCNPYQDTQAIIRLAKITPYNGAVGTVKILWSRHALPDNTSYFHAYQVGQIHPELLGLHLPANGNAWVKVSEVMGLKNLIVELFNDVGLMMPRHECYYKWTAEKNLVFLVKDMSRLGINLGEEALCMRLYANTFFHSGLVNSSGVEDYIRCIGQHVTTQTEHNAIIQTYNTYYAVRGIAVRAYVNGYLVRTLSPATCKMGDTAEVLVDTSIRQVITYQLSELPQFHSTLDNKYKYLLKSPVEGTLDAEIIYADDLDICVFDSTEPIANQGVAYHQRHLDSVRMVTHVDYALPVAYLDDFSGQVAAWGAMQSLSVRLYVRRTGNTRRLPNEANRIKELYKLPFAECGRAMLGIDATVPNWRAEVLENSAYAKLMRVTYNDVTLALVQQAYGYNAISKVVGDNPVAPLSGTTGTYRVPYLMRQLSTAYEYDGNGLLLGNYLHNNDEFYAAQNPATRLVEFIYGRGNLEGMYCVYGTAPVSIPNFTDFRCYACSVNEFGHSLNNWTDVTGTGSYLVSNGVLTWTLNSATQQGMVRLDSGFLAYTSSLALDALGYMVHTLPGADPKAQSKLQFVPHAQYDYWLNGHPLVESIDYIQHGYNLVIFSKTHLVGGAEQAQSLTVRGAGFCTPALARDSAGDVGFVKYGLLSQNQLFNVRDDKVMRITVGGALKQSSDYVFAENAQVFNSLAQLNGRPYQIRDMIVPFAKLVVGDIYAMREASMAIDTAVSDYLTLKLPEPTPFNVNTIPSLYPLYSPFLAAIISAYLNGLFRPTLLVEEYGDAEVMQVCEGFEWMLAFDPTQDANRPDPEYATVHPHASDFVIAVPVNFYAFLNNVVRIYLHNRVNLSHFLSIAPI